MSELESEDLMSWGKLNCNWDRAKYDRDLLDMIMREREQRRKLGSGKEYKVKKESSRVLARKEIF